MCQYIHVSIDQGPLFWCLEVYRAFVERVVEPICGGSSVQGWVVGCVPKET